MYFIHFTFYRFLNSIVYRFFKFVIYAFQPFGCKVNSINKTIYLSIYHNNPAKSRGISPDT